MTKNRIKNELTPEKLAERKIMDEEYDLEYLTVKQVSELTNQSTRNVRRIIFELKNDWGYFIHKDENYKWRINEACLPFFKPKRVTAEKYYALTISPYYNHSESEIDEIMKFVFEQTKDSKLEINYVIEHKIANYFAHLHCFIKCDNKRKLIESIRLAFSRVSYHQTGIFDLEGWKNYITKDNNEIKTLKKIQL